MFFVLTVRGNAPAGRPFGAMMEHDGKLYFSTATMKDVYRQLLENPAVQIVALKSGTREWLRMDGRAEECHDLAVKQKMLEECPALQKHFSAPDAPQYAVFELKDRKAYWNPDGKFVEIV